MVAGWFKRVKEEDRRIERVVCLCVYILQPLSFVM